MTGRSQGHDGARSHPIGVVLAGGRGLRMGGAKLTVAPRGSAADQLSAGGADGGAATTLR